MAIPFAAIEVAARAIRVESARRVLDLGSGFSSVSLRHLKRRGDLPSVQTLVSVGDDPKWLTASRAYCRERGFDDAGFHLWDDPTFRAGEYDLVIYDLGNMQLRGDALPAALRLVRQGGLIYLTISTSPRTPSLLRTRGRGAVPSSTTWSTERWIGSGASACSREWDSGPPTPESSTSVRPWRREHWRRACFGVLQDGVDLDDARCASVRRSRSAGSVGFLMTTGPLAGRSPPTENAIGRSFSNATRHWSSLAKPGRPVVEDDERSVGRNRASRSNHQKSLAPLTRGVHT